MTRIPRLLTLALVLSSTLAGCGDRRDAPAKAPAAPVAEATPVATTSDSPAPPDEQDVVVAKVPMPVPEDVAAPPAQAATTKTGVRYRSLVEGEGEPASVDDGLELRFTVWLRDGSVVTTTGDQAVAVRHKTVPPEWRDVVLSMKPGARVRVWTNAKALAALGAADTEPTTAELELVRVLRAPAPPATLSAPPTDATTTESGIGYVLSERGQGPKPSMTDTVRISLSAWREDGRMIESSEVRGAPDEVAVADLLPGLSEMLQLLSVGDRAQVWIPRSLVDKRGHSQPGFEVYEVALLEIVR